MSDERHCPYCGTLIRERDGWWEQFPDWRVHTTAQCLEYAAAAYRAEAKAGAALREENAQVRYFREQAEEECSRLRAQVAALDEGNARHKDEHAMLREENARVRKERDTFHESMTFHKEQFFIVKDERNRLRAQVAALDAVLHRCVWRLQEDFGLNAADPDVGEALALLNSPDLTALVAREQARTRLIEKMAEYIAERDPQHPLLAALAAVET